MVAIVFGCCGFIGRNLVRGLLIRGYEVIGVYNHSPPSESIPERYANMIHFCPFDSVIDYLEKSEKPSVCFDFAWNGTSGTSRSDINLQLSNITTRFFIIQLCHDYGMKYIGAGSIMEKESIISTYNDCSHPNYSTFYGHTKYLAHAYSKALANELNVCFIWGRITNSYGPGEKSHRLLCDIMARVISGKPLTFSSGAQLYDFIYIDDLVNAFILLSENGVANKDYVVGSGCPRPLREYLTIVNSAIAPEVDFSFGEDPDISKFLSIDEYDITKLREDTGYKPLVTFEEGIIRTFEYYKKCSQ